MTGHDFDPLTQNCRHCGLPLLIYATSQAKLCEPCPMKLVGGGTIHKAAA